MVKVVKVLKVVKVVEELGVPSRKRISAASRGVCVAFLLFLGLGCESPTTQLVVLINTDYMVPTEMGLVQGRVSDSGGQEISSSEFVLTNMVDPTDPTRFVVPLSFGVVPVGNDAARRIILEVDALGPDRRLLSTRRAVTGFISEQTLLLPMFIARACEDVVCPMEQTCTELGCVSDVVDPETLRPIDGGGGLDDSGVMDSAVVDSGIDAPDSSMDSSMDSSLDSSLDSSSDAGSDAHVPLDCTSPCVCTEGFCDVSCLMVSVCDVTCEGTGCAVTATAGREVSLLCASGSSCSLGASRRSDIAVTCQDGSSCDVACDNSSSCDVICEGTASCLLTCDRVSPCAISTCTTGTVTCPGGEQVCGRPCP